MVYSTELLQTEYESLLNINSTSVEKNFRIDSVQFEDVEIEYFTTIGSVIDQLGPLGSALYPDGSMREIPALPNIIQNDSINIDASNYFQTMTLYSGMMNLEITNGFPTSISNMTLLLYNANNQGIVEWIALIGGMESGLFLPSISSMVGARTSKGIEFAMGPNLSLGGIAMVFGAGYNFKSGKLNMPVNIGFVPGRKNTQDASNDYYLGEVPEIQYNTGSRFSITLGFNMNK